jgi:transcriptional regulator NrdR family protein
MMCPTCGADSSVDATREYLGVFSRRRRLCVRGHRFDTYEVYAGNLDRRTLTATKRGLANKLQSTVNRLTVLASPCASASMLARELGITEARVRQIRGAP